VVDARRMNEFLEEQILKLPEQYYWVHRRFKHRPPGMPAVYWMLRIVRDPAGSQCPGEIRRAVVTTRRGTGLAVAAALVLAGCGTVQTPTTGDPLEGLNRTVFTFNDKVDQHALKPVAQAYVRALPQPVQDSVTNFFSNIGDVYTAANDLLQLKITDGVEDVMRVAINTVFGVGGLFDVATIARLPKHTPTLG
jgi:MlaA lipoprotein/Bacterial lipid A biosynthesis acyltransferase